VRRHVIEALGISAAALLVTVVLAAPVIRAPSERIFGAAVVGRHHDPFTVMEQLERPLAFGVHSQPITDGTGALIARLSGGVAAYNWLVLLSFPFSAWAAYLLARHLLLPPLGASVAAMAYAFSPYHLAHAAYHPHVAQIQWLPLYLLALWRCLDHASPAAVVWLAAATVAVTFSNFYGGLIAAVITPVAVVSYWFGACRTGTQARRSLLITLGSLVVLAAAGMVYGAYAFRDVADRAAFAFPRGDLFRYSAKWWSYLVPPVEHPWVGASAARLWNAAGVSDGLLEQQVFLGWSLVALAAVAVLCWLGRDGPGTARARVPILLVVAFAALLCSLSPERTVGSFTFVRPSALLYDVVPMFRAYARFGVVVQLMVALLAGIGIDYLRRLGTRRAQVACAIAVALVGCEYAVLPSSLWRDVLPTAAHRWIMRAPGHVLAFDCLPLDQESASVPWLTGQRITMGGATSDCIEPNLADRLAAVGYTHLIVRRNSDDSQPLAPHLAPRGMRLAAMFDDGMVLAITAGTPMIYTAAMTGFFRRERDVDWSWRWMGADAAWTIVNTGAGSIVARLDLELSAFHQPRQLALRVDGRVVQTLAVDPSRRIYQLDPLTVLPGEHELALHAVDPPTVAAEVINNGDRRPLSFAVGAWNWAVGQPRP
jgi:hypothetical protein